MDSVQILGCVVLCTCAVLWTVARIIDAHNAQQARRDSILRQAARRSLWEYKVTTEYQDREED